MDELVRVAKTPYNMEDLGTEKKWLSSNGATPVTDLLTRHCVMGPEFLRKAVTHSAGFELKKASVKVVQQFRRFGRKHCYPVYDANPGDTHVYKSSQILAKILLSSLMWDILELEQAVARYARWASDVLPSMDNQCSELFKWIQAISSLRNSGMLPDEQLASVSKLHLESAEMRRKLKCIQKSPYQLRKIVSALEKLCSCDEGLSEQRTFEQASQIEHLVLLLQDCNLSRASLDIDHSRRPIEGSEIVIDHYIDVSQAVDSIFELCNSFPAVLHNLDRLIKTSLWPNDRESTTENP